MTWYFADSVLPSPALLDEVEIGSPPDAWYRVEEYELDENLVVDKSIHRIKGVASVDPSRVGQFWGLSALRIDIQDAPGVVDGTDPYLCGLRVRVGMRADRTITGVDDTTGVMIVNTSIADFGVLKHGTEALYIGHSGGATKDWNGAIGIDTLADRAIAIDRGPYQYGILITGAISVAAFRAPNNAPYVQRNAADSANVVVVNLDGSNHLRFKDSAMSLLSTNDLVVNAASASLLGGGKGIQARSTDGTAMEVSASADTAASVSASLFARGRSGSADITGVVQANSGGIVRIGSNTNHELAIRTNATDRIRISNGGNIGFFGGAPAAKPTAAGSRGGNAALASLLTGLAGLGLITDSTTA